MRQRKVPKCVTAIEGNRKAKKALLLFKWKSYGLLCLTKITNMALDVPTCELVGVQIGDHTKLSAKSLWDSKILSNCQASSSLSNRITLMMFWQYLLIFGAAMLAGAINGIAGGGSFILFPAFLSVGIPPITANATNAIALLPGTLASAGAYYREFQEDRRSLIQVCILGIIGGLLGAILLLRTPSATFLQVLPYLLLVATLAFTFSRNLTKWVEGQQSYLSKFKGLKDVLIIALQLIVAVYGGFFGGGMGILFLASFALMGMTNIHRMNAYKVILTSCINAVIIIPFVAANVILWRECAIAAIGASIGGYISAYYAQKISPVIVRRFVIVIASGMTLYFFWRNF